VTREATTIVLCYCEPYSGHYRQCLLCFSTKASRSITSANLSVIWSSESSYTSCAGSVSTSTRPRWPDNRPRRLRVQRISHRRESNHGAFNAHMPTSLSSYRLTHVNYGMTAPLPALATDPDASYRQCVTMVAKRPRRLPNGHDESDSQWHCLWCYPRAVFVGRYASRNYSPNGFRSLVL
jgi:hypothetical protein